METKKVSLWDNIITYSKIMEEVELNEGVLSKELEEQLDIVEANLEDKLRAYKHIINTNKAVVETLKDEITNFRNKIETSNKMMTKLKRNVYFALGNFGNYNGKTYSKKYDDFTVYTKDTESVNYNEEKLDDILSVLDNYPDEINKIVTAEVTIKMPIKDIKCISFDYDGELDVQIKPQLSKTKSKELLEEREHLLQTNPDSSLLKRIDKIISDLEITKTLNQSVVFK
jgi:hypothetical protein